MADPIYTVRDWDKYYENNRSRSVDRLHWVLIPNKHDGEGFGMVMIQENAAELFTAWVLILQVASKCQVRGRLVTDDGRPMTPEILAVKTRGKVEWFRRAFNFFTNNVLWLDCQATDTKVSPGCHPPDEEEKGREGKGKTLSPAREGVADLSPTWDQVEQAASNMMIPTSIAERFYDDMEACGWLDAKSRPIRNFQHALKAWATRYQDNEARKQQHGGGSRQNGSRVDRNAGTSNAGRASEYRNV